jgi:molybdenum cofactor sulfurtransferase
MTSEDFPQLKDELYLDSTGSPPVPKPVLEAFFNDMTSNIYGNPHSTSPSSLLTSTKIIETRSRILQSMNTTLKEYSIIFTLNATNAIKLIQMINYEKVLVLDQSHTSILGISINPIILNEHKVNNNIEIGPGLFCYPAQCNFSGNQYDLNWIHKYQQRNFHVLIDSASYSSTNQFNLSKHPADFLVLSFYKLFGFPTGLGCLIVKNKHQKLFRKDYFGGGTVDAIAIDPFYLSPRIDFTERMEDGTVAFQQIIGLNHGFDYIESRFGDWLNLSQYVISLYSKCRLKMENLKHGNKSKLVSIFPESLIGNGPIIAFNVLNPDGSIIGYNDVMRLCSIEKIHVRSGRFCNPGAAQKFLKLSSKNIRENKEIFGHVCGDGMDLVDGRATGAIRISFSFANCLEDIDRWVTFLESFIVSKDVMIHSTISLEENEDVEIDIVEIILYPIKSCGGWQTKSWRFSKSGLELDRKFIIVDYNQKVLTQKSHPKLSQIIIKDINLETNQITISAPEMDVLYLNIHSRGIVRNSLVCERDVHGEISDEYVNRWFSKFLKLDVQLLQNFDDQSSFVNHSQLLLISNQSVSALKAKIEHSDHINNDSFRPNFVVDNKGEELGWVGKCLRFRGLRFKVQSLCERCQMVCMDEGQFKKEPLKTLARYRVNGKIVFGVYLTLLENQDDVIDIIIERKTATVESYSF